MAIMYKIPVLIPLPASPDFAPDSATALHITHWAETSPEKSQSARMVTPAATVTFLERVTGQRIKRGSKAKS
jgi:hypothetical protein